MSSPPEEDQEQPIVRLVEPLSSDENSGDQDSGSQPPASVEDIEEEARFFHEGHVRTPHAFALADEHDDLVEPPKPSPKMAPAARARRARFSKYVKGAMVAASAILALAGIRAVMGRADRIPQGYVAMAAARAEQPQPATPTPTPTFVEPQAPAPDLKALDIPPPPELAAAPAPPATVATTGALVPATTPEAPPQPKLEAKPAETKPAEAKPEAKPAEAKPAEAKPEVAAAVAAAAPASGKAAAQEKADARGLLERGKAGAAIEAGERSVALDPTDGEAWLILGAAYQEKGNIKEAHRAFQSCSKLGKRGPISECRAMLQQ